VVAVFIIIACVIIVKVWLPLRTPVESAVHGQPERIGNIEQTIFLGVHSAQRRVDEKELLLGQYRWVDKSKGVVTIPIDRAMELVVEGHR
jgi:hypothetical protein